MRCSAFLSILISCALLWAPAAPAAAETYQILDVQEVDLPGQLVRTDWTVQVGDEPVNQFQMHRLRKEIPRQTRQGALLLIPPLSNPFAFYETDERGSYDRSFAAFFAHENWEVWGYSFRGFQLESGQCESDAVDCSPMAGWGLPAIVDDVLWIRDHMEDVLPGVEPVLGGYSMGAISTLAVLDREPTGWSGAALIEGSLFIEDPAIRALNAGFCAGLEAALAAGQAFDGATLPFVRLATELAAAAPDEPSPLPGFSGLTNHQVLVLLLAVPNPSPASPTPEFVRCVGSVEADELFFCRDERVFAHTVLFYDYTDLASLRDISCSIAGDRTFTDALDAFVEPVYLLTVEFGFGPFADDLAGLFTAAPVTRNDLPGFGHADHWFTDNHRQVVESDLLRWLKGL